VFLPGIEPVDSHCTKISSLMLNAQVQCHVVHVGFLVGKVALGQVFVRDFGFTLPVIISSTFYSFIRAFEKSTEVPRESASSHRQEVTLKYRCKDNARTSLYTTHHGNERDCCSADHCWLPGTEMRNSSHRQNLFREKIHLRMSPYSANHYSPEDTTYSVLFMCMSPYTIGIY
jgi:hypothetical protein